MTKPQSSKELRAFCHEHHMEMSLTEIELESEGRPRRTSAYACPRSDCAVHYTFSKGYFLFTKQGKLELDGTPRVRCRHDGQAMYLAELKSEQRNFRLWRCPQCGVSRTNDEGPRDGTLLNGKAKSKVRESCSRKALNNPNVEA